MVPTAAIVAVVATVFLLALVRAEEIFKAHDYKLTVKKPYFYLDNHTLPFYHYFGSIHTQ